MADGGMTKAQGNDGASEGALAARLRRELDGEVPVRGGKTHQLSRRVFQQQGIGAGSVGFKPYAVNAERNYVHGLEVRAECGPIVSNCMAESRYVLAWVEDLQSRE